MNEAQRQFVLGVAGVRIWYARKPLPAAAPSPAYHFPVEPGLELAPEARALSKSAPQKNDARKASARYSTEAPGKLAEIQNLLAGAAPSKVAVKPPFAVSGKASTAAEHSEVAAPVTGKDAAKEQVETVADEPSETPRQGELVAVHWGFWRTGSWLLVSALKEGASRDLEDRLARRILTALGEGEATAMQVRWPVFSNPAVPGGDAGGLADVLRRVTQNGGQPERVLCLGVLPDKEASDRATLEPLLDMLGPVVVQGELSLAGMASQPQKKKILWTSLRPFIGKRVVQ